MSDRRPFREWYQMICDAHADFDDPGFTITIEEFEDVLRVGIGQRRKNYRRGMQRLVGNARCSECTKHKPALTCFDNDDESGSSGWMVCDDCLSGMLPKLVAFTQDFSNWVIAVISHARRRADLSTMRLLEIAGEPPGLVRDRDQDELLEAAREYRQFAETHGMDTFLDLARDRFDRAIARAAGQRAAPIAIAAAVAPSEEPGSS